MTVRTLLAAGAVALALAPSAALADDAVSDLYLTRSACSGASDILNLSPDLGAYTGNCGSIPQILGGQKAVYPSDQGPAVSLDFSRPAYIAIATTANGGLGSIGDQTVTVELIGTKATGSGTVSLGTASHTRPAAEMLRTGKTLDEFELPLTAAKGGPFKKFTLNLTVGGSEMGGYVNHGGGSYVSLPLYGWSE